MKQLIIFSTILLSTSIFSQSRSVLQKNGVFNNNLEFFSMLKVGNKHSNEFTAVSSGKYYLLKKWSSCKIKTIGKKNYTFNKCNYNIYDNRFELLQDKKVLFLKKEIINTIIIDNITFKPLNIKSDFKNKFYEQIGINNEIKIIKLYMLKKKTVPSAESLGLFENKVEVKSKNYFILKDKIVVIPKSIKKTFKLLNIKYNNKKHKKLKTKNRKDLLTILNLQ